MKQQLVLIITFLSMTVMAQQKGIITYQKRMTHLISEEEETKKLAKERPSYYQNIVKMDKNMQAVLETLEFALAFDTGHAMFTASPTLVHDKNPFLKGALNYGLGSGAYYTDRTTGNVIQRSRAIGKTFLIQHKKTEWTLHTETRKIGGYECLKATTTLQVSTDPIKEITAWYAPALPIQLGPVGYHGLPGLIMQLEFGGLVEFTVTKMNMKPKKLPDMTTPTKGNPVTREQFRAELDQAMDNFRN